MIALLIVLTATVAGLIVLALAWLHGWDRGHTTGYRSGHQDGLDMGHADAWTDLDMNSEADR